MGIGKMVGKVLKNYAKKSRPAAKKGKGMSGAKMSRRAKQASNDKKAYNAKTAQALLRQKGMSDKDKIAALVRLGVLKKKY